MLIAGAKRHAKEILQLIEKKEELDNLCFFDDLSNDLPDLLYGHFKIIRNLDALKEYFYTYKNKKFVLGLGNPQNRKFLADKLITNGGILNSIISKNAIIGNYNVKLGIGLNIMNYVIIGNDVNVGDGSLLNAFVSVHHDAVVGKYCEASPHSVLSGGCNVGDFVSIGANATILPNIKVGSNVIIGAGSVVTRDIPDNSLVVGVPAMIKKKLDPLI